MIGNNNENKRKSDLFLDIGIFFFIPEKLFYLVEC